MTREQYILFILRRGAAPLIIQAPLKLQPQHDEMAACPWEFTWKNMAPSMEQGWTKEEKKKHFQRCVTTSVSFWRNKKEKVKLVWLKMQVQLEVQTGKVTQTILKLIWKQRSPLGPLCFPPPLSVLVPAQRTRGQMDIPRRDTRSAWCSGQMLQQHSLCSPHLLVLAGSSGL